MESNFERWAIRLHKQDAWQLLELREFEGVLVAFVDEYVWANGESESRFEDSNTASAFSSTERELAQPLDLALRSIAGAERFRMLDDDQLVPYGKRVPQGHLPTVKWQSLSEIIEIELPVPGFAGQVPSPTKIQMVRGMNNFVGSALKPELLLCDFDQWSRYAYSAPQVRLDPLSFACASSPDKRAQVLVRGRPLPSIPGEHFVVLNNVAVPVGWSWRPSVSPQTIRECFRVTKNSLVILLSDGRWNMISSSQFVAAKRSAVRASEVRLVGDV